MTTVAEDWPETYKDIRVSILTVYKKLRLKDSIHFTAGSVSEVATMTILYRAKLIVPPARSPDAQADQTSP